MRLRARLADSAGCAGLCTDVAAPQAFLSLYVLFGESV